MTDLRTLLSDDGVTPGPWTLVREVACYSGEAVRDPDGTYRAKYTYYVTRIAELGIVATAFHGDPPGDSDRRHVPPDAAFIAKARNLWPALVDLAVAAKELREAETDADPARLLFARGALDAALARVRAGAR